MIYKIEFILKSPVSFTVVPTFDALLAWCYMKDKYGYVEQKLDIAESEMETFEDMPLVRHKDGYFMASWLCFDKSIEAISSWKKRWDNCHDSRVQFKGVRKVRINAGEFKSYDMPLVTHKIDKCWFYFISEDVDRVRVLVSNYLFGIGKKTSQGFGEIESFSIQESLENPFDGICRPIPVKFEDLKDFNSIKTIRLGYKPPYWLPSNQVACFMP